MGEKIEKEICDVSVTKATFEDALALASKKKYF